ncbi:hypothetical protein SAMN04489724_4082 [Algoriphagus locisalis]|uniref:Uncharacterized protein n=1 Tax=Algoriphagus locisalis TaxID=305507 RepID=A0A1I7DKH8_9BACT|nr:hypothetical protein SAMN04489724_4082 [Algoriphagus locisalis]
MEADGGVGVKVKSVDFAKLNALISFQYNL